MLGPGGANFDNDDDVDEDEDLLNDPVSQMDIKVRQLPLIPITCSTRIRAIWCLSFESVVLGT